MKWLVVLLLGAVSACRYAVPEARGAAPQRQADAGPADAAVNEPHAESFGHSLIGLTRKQLLARPGRQPGRNATDGSISPTSRVATTSSPWRSSALTAIGSRA